MSRVTAVIEKHADLIDRLAERMVNQCQEISSLKQRLEVLEKARG